ncbi:MAG: hypothetical protein RXO35_02790 [Candidatus Micrarchaeota archaeon]
MKIQTSLEFILILGAVSLLVLSVVSVYSNKISQAKTILGLNLTMPRENASYMQNLFNISAYVPLQTYVGSQYSLDYVILCPQGYANISIYAPNILLSKDKINKSIDNIFAGYVYFVPEQSGTENLILSYKALCNGAKYNGTLLLPTYATYLSFENRSAVAGSFSITKRNEFIRYNYSGVENIFAITTWSHCSLWHGIPYSMGIFAQCGTSNAWDYFMFNGYCYTEDKGVDSTTCIYPTQTAYNLSTINSYDHTFLYNFTIEIDYQGLRMSAIFNNTECTKVFQGNAEIGTACISNISGIGPLNYASLISNGTKSGIANQTLYQSYSQARNNLYSTLDFFNGSSITSSEQSQINSAINYYSKIASDLEEYGFENESNCYIGSSYVICKPVYPLAYVINATLNESIVNTTLYFQGSILNLRGK